ncbi:CRM-domain containing factor CFM3, chloroplastic/mitochondrial [Populus nigra]|uniref:CRM-domain containing factor CFM3, chloroplastic/mitochondrial n=1 Tax=Populus nigra TaxID=3691 RepID=UPI002B277199|nr:CRM-domain containing factor CFM3, chloroplastic/mitochondrial [Populus nigra]
MALSFHTCISSLNPLLLQPQNPSPITFKFTTYCPSNRTVQVHAAKSKRKPKPSFFEQIHHKWSLKLTSTRDKFPWQEQEQQQQQQQQEEEEEEDIKEVDAVPSVSDTVSFNLPNRLTTPPWIHGATPKQAHFDYQPRKGDNSIHGVFENREDNVVNGVIDKEERIEKEVNLDNNFKEQVVDFDDASVFQLPEAKEIKDCSVHRYAENREEDSREDNVANKKESVGKKINCNLNKFKDNHYYNSVELPGDKEKSIVTDLNDVVSLTEKPFDGDDGEFGNIEVCNDGHCDSFENLSCKDLNDVVSVTKKQLGDFENVEVSNNGVSNSNELPWKRTSGLDSLGEDKSRKKSNTDLAERMLPEHELKRLRNVALRMLERIKVGATGITQDLVDAIHEKWKLDEVVKLKFEWPLSCNMRRTHEILESRTGGLIIWRSGSSVVLYRGTTYKFQCVQSYTKQNEAGMDVLQYAEEATNGATSSAGMKDLARTMESIIPDAAKYLKDLSQEELMDFSELNHLLDELGPRYKDWCGREPLPVDADLLPAVVPGYKSPLRLLPYGVKPCLSNKNTTNFRRLARTTPPHFVLGRNRELQGLANAMVKLWERSAIAKIAIKRGVQYTRNEIMAEELKRLTGGTLLSRNKEYIVFYRGNDFLPPVINETLKERRKLAFLYQDEEDQARQMTSAFIGSSVKATKGPLVAGTLVETVAAISRWGNQPSSEDVEEMIRDSSLARHASLVKHLENKLAQAKGKLKKSEKDLAKVQENLEPTELPTDLETISDEERFLFRKIGLSMKPYLFLGRRGVFDGTIENMHLHWKYRELVKIIVERKGIAQVKHIAISLEAESGGLLVSVDRTTKGYAIIVYRGKNYMRPQAMRPENLLTRRQALARSVELQRYEALKHHITDLQERIELVTSELEEMEADKKSKVYKALHSKFDDASILNEDKEGEEEPIFKSKGP